MNRRSILKAGAIGAAATAFGSVAVRARPAKAQQTVRWRVQSHWPSASSSFNDSLKFLQKRLEERTQGRFQLQLHEAGALFPATEIFNAVSRGVIEMGTSSPAYMLDKLTLAGFGAGLPFAFREPWEAIYFHKMLGYEEAIREEAAQFGVYYSTDKVYATELVLKKPVANYDEFTRLKIRSSGALQKFLTEAGAAASYVAGPELYPALATGVMDGAHWGAAQGAQSMGLYEVCKYHVKPSLTIAGTDVLIVNQKKLDALPDDLRETFIKLLDEQFYWRSTEYQYLERITLTKSMKDLGVQIFEWPDDVQQRLTETALKVWEEEGKKSDRAGEMLAKLKTFLTDLGYL